MVRISTMIAAAALLFAAAPAFAQAEGSETGAPAKGHHLMQKFEAANTTHDGHLTEAQAESGGMKRVAKNFAAIDTDKKGYVTIEEIRAYRKAQRAAKAGDAK